jgi:hypothetical protein
MSILAWSILWQIVVAGACISFFGVAMMVAGRAVREAREMFDELANSQDSPDSKS